MENELESWEGEFNKITYNIGEHHSQDCCDYWHSDRVPKIQNLIRSLLKQSRASAFREAVEVVSKSRTIEEGTGVGLRETNARIQAMVDIKVLIHDLEHLSNK